jgi:hypothetical protein
VVAEYLGTENLAAEFNTIDISETESKLKSCEVSIYLRNDIAEEESYGR